MNYLLMKKHLPAFNTFRIATVSFLLGLCLLSTSFLYANDFVVSNGNNAGAGSLRQAILDANASPAVPHTITFTVTGVINITSSLPTITRQVAIDGGNPASVTISGPGGNNTIALFVLGTGSGGSAIRNLTMRNTGLEPIRLSVALNNITIENMVLTQTGVHYMNRAILANAAVTGLTIRNVTVTGLEDKMYGIYLVGNATNVMIDGYKLSAGGGASARGIQVTGVANGFTVKNSIIDLDDPATADDGDYGIVFSTSAINVTIDSSTFRDNEINAVYCGAGVNTFSIKNSRFDNLDGWTKTKFVYFKTNATNVTIDKNIFNADYRTSTDDGDNGLYLNGGTNQAITITNNQFIENDTLGIYLGAESLTNNHDNVLIKGNTFSRNGNGSNASGGINFLARNLTSDGGPVLITENTFSDNNGNAIMVRPGNTTSYVLPNFTISKNIVYNTKSVYGAIRIQYVDKVIITQNSIYNNQGIGIELVGAANCGYEGATYTPQILSSVETSAGIYTVTVKMPTICGSGNCSLELFSNEAGIKGIGGQHYVTTLTGLGSGNRVLTGITGSFPEIIAAPYGAWSATLRVTNNNCGTSEFGNKKAIKANGPAGISNGIAVWLRGDDLSVANAEPTASGQVITGWEEFSGGGGPSATTIISNPLTKLNGINFNPVADMDGDGIRGHLSGAPSWITTPTTTSVAVFNPFSISASGDRFYTLFAQTASDYNTNLGQMEFYRTGNNINSYRGSTLLNPPIFGTTGVKAFDRPGVFSSVTSATNHSTYYNGANMGSGNYSKGNFAISQWFVGTGWNTTDSWNAQAETDFAEVFTYNRVLTAIELQKVQSYMALKYGIAMKQNYVLSDGTLIWDVTANAAYSKEIAALVRDNVSVLHQKQAKAFHTDEVISIAAGDELAATNKDNEDSVTNNLSVFMWGNDSAATAYTKGFTAGTYSSTRMTRVWKVQKLNWADKNITIKVNAAKDNNYLLISTDPTFATISQELKLGVDGTISISSALLTNGVYFTVGRQQKAPGGVSNGLSVWTKADEGVTMTGANATAWEDQSPSQRIWAWANTGAIGWSGSSFNYNPALQFTGANYFRVNQFTPSYTQGEVFSVQSSAVNNVASFPWQLGGSSGSVGVVYRYTDNNMYLNFGVGARRNFLYGTKNMALPVLLNVSSAANSWTASLDGKIMAGPSTVTTSFTQVSGLAYNYIGAGHVSVLNGLMPEVVLYNRKLTATERQQVNSYMALRYGITLDQTTPTDYLASDGTTTMWKASDNTGFANNIAGIGRDEIGSLYQKQSRSINTAVTGNLIAIGVGSELAASNADNSDTILNNKSFLVWGDNNGATTYTTNVAGANVTLRMPRVWKVDKTNWATREITIKLHGSASNTYLLISNANATFATIDQELALNGDSTITLSSDLLPDGAYFTFAKQIIGPGFVNAGVQLWLRADDGVSAPAVWYDYSGNDKDASQATVANQPVAVPNGANFNPTFNFDGIDDYMDIANNLGITGTNPFTVVGVGKRETVGTRDGLLLQQNSVANNFMYYWETDNKLAIGLSSGGSTLSTNAYSTPNIPYLTSATRSGNTFGFYINGASNGSNTAAFSFTTANMRIGNRATSADAAFDGPISEVIAYNRALNSTELQRVHSYLALKYGITVDQTTATDYVATDWDGTTGTKMWTAAKNGIYNKNIAGIGRDDKTTLYQKQSRSANDTLITIAAGSAVAADNASNSANIDDLSFFAWADDGGATTFSVATVGVSNATARMPRVWKVDRTNWSDQEITIKAVQGGDRYLLVNTTDATFAAGTVEYPINTATGTVTINTADLPDGAFFTLATKIVGPACVNNGIATWLRADYAAAVNSWVDFSGNQTNATQATAANQPALSTNVLNYNPALIFNGTTDNLIVPYASIAGKYSFAAGARTIIGVGAAALANPGYGMMIGYGSVGAATGTFLGQSGVTPSSAGFGGYNTAPNNVTGTSGSLPVSKPTIIGGRYTGTVAHLDVNGALNASLTTAWNTTAAQPAYIGVGATVTSQYWNGSMGEVIVYNRELTAPELLRVNSYLAIKYGITLNQTVATDYIASDGTTRMWTAADNTGFNRRITGIGRDDCTELYQKQSLSVDTGIVAVAIGDAVAASNLDNAATIDNDNAWFVFADDGAAILYNTTISGLDDLTARMARTWKVDKTNWADAGVTFKLTGGNNKIYMVVSADATFDGADAAWQLDADGNVTIPSVEIPDGAYFTFAKALNGPGFVNVGVQLWLRADDNVSTVDSWLDYSGNDNNATQATAANQPVAVTSSVNFNPAFDFDGTDDYLDFATNGTITGTNPFTIASVQVRNTVGTADAVIAQQATTTNNMINYYTAANKYGIAPNGGTTVTSTGTYATANIPLLAATTRAGNLFSLYNNGSADGTGTQPFNFLTTNLRLGNRAATADAAFDGHINEVVVFNRALSATELRQVHSYLALKYGITMAGDYIATDGTTAYWTAANNTGYLNNITGIGRDDNTGLYQKQSRSVNTAANANMVVIGVGSIAATNKDNTGIFENDLSYLVWGDNALTGTKNTEYPTSLDPGGCSKITRLQREWKVQETGDAGDVQLQLYLAGQVATSTSKSDIRLLIDDDGDFGNGGTTVIDATAYDEATQIVQFDNINFASGQYFTLVTDLTNQAPGGVITNLYTWYRADKGVTAATGVSLWTDQSAVPKNVTGAAGAQPLYNTTGNLINFNPNLGFDGTNDVLINNAISHTAATNGEDFFAVVLPNTLAGAHNIVGLGTGASSSNTTEFRFNNNLLQYGAGAGFTTITNTASSNGIAQLANGNRSSAGAASLLLNGTSVASGTIAPMFTLDYLNIGSRRITAANSLFFNGRIAEVAIYNRQLNTAERQKVASYLAIKYGITLPHNYVDPAGAVIWDVTANTGYGFNITGIGRDDCNGLHQKQSKSVNTAEALVTLGNYVGIVATNAANANNMDNATALLLGDNNGNRTAWTATGAPLNRERLARTWRVQETGNVGTVTIQAPANSSSAGVKLPLEKDGVVYLLVSTTGNFVTDVTEVPMTLNGTDWEAAVDFTSGQYFTFATNDACVSAAPLLTTYGGPSTTATDECYVDGWILFKDPVDNTKYIAGIYDPSGLIDRSKISVKIDATTPFADLGEGNATQAVRLMRRMLQVDCATCYDAVTNPNPGFIVRMFYDPAEKAGAENVETNNMEAIKTTNGITDPHVFKWFKASGKTITEVVTGLYPGGVAAGGQEWFDGALGTGQLNGIDYVDFASVNSFSTFGGIWAVNLLKVLPVTWVSVQASPAGSNTIKVKWGVVAQSNNAGFTVERSQDGLHFQAVASVAPQADNPGMTTYYSIDDNTVTPGVTYYYRIRQMDLDGRVGYSRIVTARLNLDNLQYLHIKPNPVSGTLRWEAGAAKPQNLQVNILDARGRLLKQKKVHALAGHNQYAIEITGFTQGTYLLQVVAEDGNVTTEKFIVRQD